MLVYSKTLIGIWKFPILVDFKGRQVNMKEKFITIFVLPLRLGLLRKDNKTNICMGDGISEDYYDLDAKVVGWGTYGQVILGRPYMSKSPKSFGGRH